MLHNLLSRARGVDGYIQFEIEWKNINKVVDVSIPIYGDVIESKLEMGEKMKPQDSGVFEELDRQVALCKERFHHNRDKHLIATDVGCATLPVAVSSVYNQLKLTWCMYFCCLSRLCTSFLLDNVIRPFGAAPNKAVMHHSA